MMINAGELSHLCSKAWVTLEMNQEWGFLQKQSFFSEETAHLAEWLHIIPSRTYNNSNTSIFQRPG